MLAWLEFLVHREEVLNLQLVVGGDVADVLEALHARVGRHNAEHLVVGALLIPHPEHADGPAADEAPRERRLLQQHQRIERVAVVGESVLDEAVV